jgi:Zn-dependent protease
MAELALPTPLNTSFLSVESSGITIRTSWWSIVFKWGSFVMMGLFIIAAGMLSSKIAAGTTGTFSFIWTDAVIAGSLAYLSLFLHENGHAVAARFTGRKVLRLQFGIAGGAVTSGNSTPLRRIIGLAAGPLAEIAFGSVLLLISLGSTVSPLTAAAAMALVNGVGNLIPFHKSMDGSRILHFARLHRAGVRELTCEPEGPCPACYGQVTKV